MSTAMTSNGKAPTSTDLSAPTPPITPTDEGLQQFITREELKDLLVGVLRPKEPSNPSQSVSCGPSDKPETGPKEESRIRASKLEYKTVEEVWDEKNHKYKIRDSLEVPEVTELDEYVFVVRVRIDRTTGEPRAYFDIKSGELHDILKTVLQDVKAVSLEADKPTVDRDLLYNCLPKLEHYARSPDAGVRHAKAQNHLALLIACIKRAYRETTERLQALLAEGKITYDLLWALFKPGQPICTSCRGSGKPRSLMYDFGENKKTKQGVEYFELTGRYFDFDGEVFGEVEGKVSILGFHGAVPISKLAVFPLHHHPKREAMEEHLRNCGRRFIKLTAKHHCHYQGVAFFEGKDGIRKQTVDGRIMVDASRFREVNPGYPKLQDRIAVINMRGDTVSDDFREKVKCTGKPTDELTEDDLLVCSPTVLGFSFGSKIWAEFAIDNIGEIDWSPAAFDHLVLPAKKKELVMALGESRMGEGNETRFDDFITNKGRGVIVLLSGPPGVGKTLTAEALSERFKSPLYSISAGQLSSEAEVLDYQLDQTFETASRWKALLLLDEADVFLTQRSSEHIHRNRLVATFLQKLEYFEGILFLTTNQPNGLDTAILNRVHLSLKYSDLGNDARKDIFQQFLQKDIGLKVNVDDQQLTALAQVNLNGRQIKNTMSIACMMAAEDGELTFEHVRSALIANGHCVPEPGLAQGRDELYE
ncbi:hypothetical protein AJ80_04038 [Polytolypa hystricis UAMH7299]|uniref:AAA+ ATPase domain-containing protein n=1 Tax=Polytolypa hystricis (strain UAMH7299) TaxID=1447883 RepID=A0A2B7YDD8_POLH7|nr:hypothetical protein AJ80_04038 [Polytolypa hystricis UAMH7299]